MATRAPASASRFAIDSPMPRLPPDTRATLPLHAPTVASAGSDRCGRSSTDRYTCLTVWEDDEEDAMAGLIAYGAYIPYHRLKRSEIAAVLGEGGGKGTRAVASYDEDPTSMAVEAGRVALRGGPAPNIPVPERILFATANPPYLDKTNAAVIHAALDLPASALAVDAGGAVRSGVGALLFAAESRRATLAVLSDVRTGLPGGADEREGGDGAAAFRFGGDSGAPVLAELIATASTTDEFLERWRTPGAPASRVWEERFGEHVYGPLADAALADAFKQAGLSPGDVDHLAVAGLAARAVKRFAAGAGVRPEAA